MARAEWRAGHGLLYSISSLVLGVQLNVVGPTAASLAAQVGATEAALGPVVGLGGIGLLVGGLPAGWLLDKLPGHVVIASALAMQSTAFFLLPHCSSLFALSATYALAALTFNAITTGSNALILWRYPASHGAWLNLSSALFGVGCFLAPVLAEYAMTWEQQPGGGGGGGLRGMGGMGGMGGRGWGYGGAGPLLAAGGSGGEGGGAGGGGASSGAGAEGGSGGGAEGADGFPFSFTVGSAALAFHLIALGAAACAVWALLLPSPPRPGLPGHPDYDAMHHQQRLREQREHEQEREREERQQQVHQHQQHQLQQHQQLLHHSLHICSQQEQGAGAAQLPKPCTLDLEDLDSGAASPAHGQGRGHAIPNSAPTHGNGALSSGGGAGSARTWGSSSSTILSDISAPAISPRARDPPGRLLPALAAAAAAAGKPLTAVPEVPPEVLALQSALMAAAAAGRGQCASAGEEAGDAANGRVGSAGVGPVLPAAVGPAGGAGLAPGLVLPPGERRLSDSSGSGASCAGGLSTAGGFGSTFSVSPANGPAFEQHIQNLHLQQQQQQHSRLTHASQRALLPQLGGGVMAVTLEEGDEEGERDAAGGWVDQQVGAACARDQAAHGSCLAGAALKLVKARGPAARAAANGGVGEREGRAGAHISRSSGAEGLYGGGGTGRAGGGGGGGGGGGAAAGGSSSSSALFARYYHELRWGWPVLVPVTLLLFANISVQASFGAWVTTYCRRAAGLDDSTAQRVTAAYWAAFTSTRLAGVGVAPFLHASSVLLVTSPCAVLGALLAVTGLPQIPGLLPAAEDAGSHAFAAGLPLWALYVVVCLVGVGVATGFANTISLTSDHVSLDGFTNGILSSVAGLASTLCPAAVPWLAQRTRMGYGALMAVSLLMSVAQLAMVLCALAGAVWVDRWHEEEAAAADRARGLAGGEEGGEQAGWGEGWEVVDGDEVRRAGGGGRGARRGHGAGGSLAEPLLRA